MDFAVQTNNLVKEPKGKIRKHTDRSGMVEQTATAGCLSMLIAYDTI